MVDHFQKYKKIENASKGLLIPLDGSITQAIGHSDDWHTDAISLPFDFQFYGETHTDFYINNNGKISFGSAFFTYTSVGFPIDEYPMPAPF